MRNLIQDLKNYINELLSLQVSVEKWDGADQLPFYLRNPYAYYQTELLNHPCLLMIAKTVPGETPATVQKHLKQVKERWESDVVYINSWINSYNRKRLIEYNLPFIIPGNQMYLPGLGLDLREHFKRMKENRDVFSPSTQAVFLYILYQRHETEYTPTDLAKKLGYAIMTITRAFNELNQAEIGLHFSRGKERLLAFTESSNILWNKALPFLKTPVWKRIYITSLVKGIPAVSAGLSALASYSMLAEPSVPVFALIKDEWKILCQQHTIIELDMPEQGAIQIELWNYSPALFAHGGIVDRLSLYLSLMHNSDERVSAALEQMMEAF